MGEIRGRSKTLNQAVRLELKTMVCSFMLPTPWEVSVQSLGLRLPPTQGVKSLLPLCFLFGLLLYSAQILQCTHTLCLVTCGESWAIGNVQHKVADCSGKAAPIQHELPPYGAVDKADPQPKMTVFK